MRIIKYKQWHNGKKKAFKVCSITNGDKKTTKPILQYTCLKDKNGREIYEFDVIKVDQDFGNVKAGHYIVTYNQGCFMITRDSQLNYMDHYLWFIAEQCEVVENYFENKINLQRLKVRSVIKKEKNDLLLKIGLNL